MKLRVLTIIAALVAAQPAAADPKPEERAAAKEAEVRGAEMYAYDQAAWHATDRFMVDLQRSRGNQSELSGYIVEPAESGLLKTTFFAKRDDVRYAYAVYWVRGSTVERGGLIDADGARELSMLAQRMIAARDAAIDQATKSDYQKCNSNPPNTLVLPPRPDGGLPVYILTSNTSNSSYPAGGHYRFDFDAKNRLIGHRRFMNSCFDLTYENSKGERPAAVVISHLLDPQPTEIHAFVSHYIPAYLMIATITNKQLWSISAGSINHSRDMRDR